MPGKRLKSWKQNLNQNNQNNMKQIFCKNYLAKLIVVSMLLSINLFAFGKDNLNGKTFTIKLTVSGDEREGIKWTSDELHFHDGAFTSSFMTAKEKFPEFKYDVIPDTSSEENVRLTATARNDGESTISWEIKITGNSIEGIAIWTNMHGPQKEFFKGSLKEKK